MSPNISNTIRPLKQAAEKGGRLFADPKSRYKGAVFAVSAGVILFSFLFIASIAWSIVGETFGGPKVAPPEDYAQACEYALSNELGREEAGIKWIEENTDYPFNAYIGLIGVRAQTQGSRHWSATPEYEALVAQGKKVLPAIDKKLAELSRLERERMHANARIAVLTGNIGDHLPGNNLWSWQNALKSARDAIKKNK